MESEPQVRCTSTGMIRVKVDFVNDKRIILKQTVYNTSIEEMLQYIKEMLLSRAEEVDFNRVTYLTVILEGTKVQQAKIKKSITTTYFVHAPILIS